MPKIKSVFICLTILLSLCFAPGGHASKAPGFEHIDGAVDARTPDANTKARQLADSQYK